MYLVTFCDSARYSLRGYFLFMEEVWKDIIGYEWLYYVSNYWNIKSSWRWGKILKNTPQLDWYISFRLCKWWEQKNLKAHRLVALAFIPNPENKPYINHKNGIKTDNRVENLEWCTCSENLLHAFRIWIKKHNENNYFTKNTPEKGKFGKYHNSAKAVSQYDLKWNLIKNWGSIIDAWKELKICSIWICMCCKMKRNKAWGFIWSYLERKE